MKIFQELTAQSQNMPNGLRKCYELLP